MTSSDLALNHLADTAHPANKQHVQPSDFTSGNRRSVTFQLIHPVSNNDAGPGLLTITVNLTQYPEDVPEGMCF